MHLVTGGSGYFGQVLVKNLLSKGEQVRIFDLNEPNIINSEGAEFFQGDIRDEAAIFSACNNIKFIHHNVAQVPLAKDKRLFHSVNIDGTKNLLNSAVSSNVGKVIYTSSSAVFGVPHSNPVDEEYIPHPVEPYGLAKYNAELIAKDFVNRGLNVSILRPRTILGHGRLGIFQILFDWIKNGYNIPVLDDGKNIYQFIHADDLAEISFLISQTLKPETYNAGATKFCSMRESLEALCNYAETGSKVVNFPFKFADICMNISSNLGLSPLGKYHSLMYGRSLYFTNHKVMKELKYQTKFDNISALCDSYDWYIRNYETVKNLTNGSPHQKFVKQGILKLLKYLL